MKIALGAKVKLRFINGKYKMLNEDSLDFKQQNIVDYMVTSWILNSIAEDFVEAFLYTTPARDLRKELKERFGESNGPFIVSITKRN